MNQNKEDKKVKFQSSPVLAFTQFIVGVLIIWGIIDVIKWICPIYLPLGQSEMSALAISAVFALIMVTVRYTVVKVSEQTIEVKRLFKKFCYSLDEYEITQESKQIYDFSILSELYKHYLVAEDKNGNKENIRLYYFIVNRLDKLNNHLLSVKVRKNAEIAAKNRTFRETFYEENTFHINRDSVIKREWKNVKKISLVWICLMTILLFATFIGYEGYYSLLQIFATFAVSLACVICIPFHIFRTKRNEKSCPSQILFSREHFLVGTDYYTMPNIRCVSITSTSLTSNSVYPIQRYLIVETMNGEHRYWLGSQCSMTENEYQRVFHFVSKAFLSYPDKFKINGKRSLINR